MMIKAVIFDMFETLITHFASPLYFGKEMAKDMGVPVESFVKYWHESEDDRTKGIISFDEVVRQGLIQNDCFDEAVFERVVNKRIAVKEECFRHVHKDIVPMLKGIHDKGAKIALISNCFSEEAKVIRDSFLFEYFDVPILSCEYGLKKPDEAIYHLCLEKLGLSAEECLYIGDGGTHELDTAKKVGMNPLQATWYLKEGTMQPVGRLPEYKSVDNPMDVLDYL